MALTDNGNELVMPVGPLYGNNGGGFGGFGGDWGSLIVLFLIAAMFGGFGGGFGFGGFGNGMLGIDFPWLLTGQQSISNNVNDGFRDQMMNDNITSIRDGVQGLSTQICNGFAGVEQGANARQMADMNQNFALQTAMLQGFNQLGSQLGECLKKIFNKAKKIFGFTNFEAVGTYA